MMSVRTITVEHFLGLFVGLHAVAADERKRSFIECWSSSPRPNVTWENIKKCCRPKFCPI